VLEFRIHQTANGQAMPRRRYRDERSDQVARLQADEHSMRHKELSGSLEGMDHARDCHSSK
jgi:hypothetical protein